jgi:hypothetical protein
MTPTTLPLPLREGVGGRGAYHNEPWLYAPLPPPPSLKGRGRVMCAPSVLPQ